MHLEAQLLEDQPAILHTLTAIDDALAKARTLRDTT
jgi:hypothetical protein